jgi:Mg-chelatase subunit ChlD
MFGILKAKRGNVAIIFALSLLPLMLFVGWAIDLATFNRALAKGQTILDTALLSPFSNNNFNTDVDSVEANVNKFIQLSNKDADFELSDATLTYTDGSWHAEATINYTPIFIEIFGIKKLNGTIMSDVSMGKRNLEITFVLDNSGSMSGERITALKSAVNSMITNLGKYKNENIKIKIGIVPFTSLVNVGSEYASASWMDYNGNSSVQKDGFSGSINRFDLFSHLGVSWAGCVMARSGGYDITDQEPSQAIPETLFVPWFWPDEPDTTSKYPNTYLKDKSGTTDLVKAKDLTKYGVTSTNKSKWTTPTWLSSYTFFSNYNVKQGPNFFCDSEAITPLTDDFTSLPSKINSMVALGGTNLTEGMAWGWRVLSPSAPFTEGEEYGVNDVEKILIFFTDGENSVNAYSNALKSDYTSWGYALTFLSGSSVTSTSIKTFLNTKTASVCKNIKNAGITIYTIGLQTSSTTAEDLLSNCATDTSDFISIDTADEIENAFSEIYKKVTQLHISK